MNLRKDHYRCVPLCGIVGEPFLGGQFALTPRASSPPALGVTPLLAAADRQGLSGRRGGPGLGYGTPSIGPLLVCGREEILEPSKELLTPLPGFIEPFPMSGCEKLVKLFFNCESPREIEL